MDLNTRITTKDGSRKASVLPSRPAPLLVAGVLLEDLTAEDGALLLADRAVRLIAAPFDLLGKSVSVSASIGVALRADDSTGTDTLIAEADAAMYEAKRAGKGRVVRSRPAVLAA